MFAYWAIFTGNHLEGIGLMGAVVPVLGFITWSIDRRKYDYIDCVN